MIFDSHAHYDDEAFDGDREALLASLPGQGIGAVMNVGANRRSTEASAELAARYDYIYAAAGIHPSDVMEFENGQADPDWLRAAARRPGVRAIGEIGLDYHWPEPERALQQKWFRIQLDIARELDLPVIIHSREAARDTWDILQEAGGSSLSAVIHCFSYEKEMAERFLEQGYYLGIGGVLTYKNARKLREVAAICPPERILLETDCPYLTPTPHRGERNSSLYLPYVRDLLAELLQLTAKEIEEITYENAKRFYRI